MDFSSSHSPSWQCFSPGPDKPAHLSLARLGLVKNNPPKKNNAINDRLYMPTPFKVSGNSKTWVSDRQSLFLQFRRAGHLFEHAACPTREKKVGAWEAPSLVTRTAAISNHRPIRGRVGSNVDPRADPLADGDGSPGRHVGHHGEVAHHTEISAAVITTAIGSMETGGTRHRGCRVICHQRTSIHLRRSCHMRPLRGPFLRFT